jgi:hypothetical protein
MSEVGAARTLEAALFGTEDAAAADDSNADSSGADNDASSVASPVSGAGNDSFDNSRFRSTAAPAPPPPPPPPPHRPTADYTGVRSAASSGGSATSPTTVAAASDLFSLFSTAPPAAAAAATTAAQSRSEKHAARHAAAALRTRKKTAASKHRGKLLPQPRQTHFAPGYVGVTWPREEPQALLDEQEHREWVSCDNYAARRQINHAHELCIFR